MLKQLVWLVAGASALSVAGCHHGPKVIVDRDAAMKTRDGVTLRADVYRPDGDGSYPVLLTRTPYGKESMETFARRGAASGYVVVVQDVRGRFGSEGEWYPFRNESNDGYDAVEWAAGLAHSNGKVGMFSGSYNGTAQVLAAIAHPPHLAGICPLFAASDFHENWVYQGGAFQQKFNEYWLGILQAKGGHDQAGGGRPGWFQDWLAHPVYDSYWKQMSIEENYAKIAVPALTVAAWYDIFQDGSLRNFMGARAQAGTAAARAGQRLLVVVGGHSGNGRTTGAVEFGKAAAEYNEDDTTLHWYNYLLKGEQNEFATAKPVKIFVMGRNEWRYEDAWPLARAKATRYSLRSRGNADGAAGDGALGDVAQASAAADSYVYDPANPVPSTGGPVCCDATTHLASGPRDQKEVEARSDVLVYSTPVLDRDVEVTGPVTLDLFASSSAEDMDFTAKLVDVWPNGFAQDLTEGILRASLRESTKGAPSAITPGKVYEYRIDLWSTANVFLKGHAIRLEVSSGNFPRFERNPKATGRATNTVYHDRLRPSALVLPVVGER